MAQFEKIGRIFERGWLADSGGQMCILESSRKVVYGAAWRREPVEIIIQNLNAQWSNLNQIFMIPLKKHMLWNKKRLSRTVFLWTFLKNTYYIYLQTNTTNTNLLFLSLLKKVVCECVLRITGLEGLPIVVWRFILITTKFSLFWPSAARV